MGVFATAFPLGASLVCSYAKKILKNNFEINLFKFPEKLSVALTNDSPALLGLSNYSWNLDLSYKLCTWAKHRNPNLVVVFGGPNYPLSTHEKELFLKHFPNIDFYIQNDGEIAFVELVKRLVDYNFNARLLKRDEQIVTNCAYIGENKFVESPISINNDLDSIPSPYLSGLMDEYFELPLIPIIETTRGCPFRCIYCADGAMSKSKIRRYNQERVRSEIDYISKRIKGVNTLMISDLNFGMYKEDILTAKYIKSIQEQTMWPVSIGTAAGKRNPQILHKVARLLGASWRPGASIQTSDKEVLKNIKRTNLDDAAFQDIINLGNALGAHSYADIILGLPGDSKEKHFASIRYCIDRGVNRINIYQAILLNGIEMSGKEIRNKYDIKTGFRVRPGCIGLYKFGDKVIKAAEIEEIIIATKNMSFDDYLSCRVMDLVVEIFINSSLYEEVFTALRTINVSTYEIILCLYTRDIMYTPTMKRKFDSFKILSNQNLYSTRAEAEQFVLQPDVIRKHISGELGTNELLDHAVMLYFELEDISKVLLNVVRFYLEANNLWSDKINEYLDQLIKFTICRKKDFRNFDEEIIQQFDYDFTEIEKLNFNVNPQDIEQTHGKVNIKFFHSQIQKTIIRNDINLFSKSSGGSGRLLQAGNMKKMNRLFAKI